MNVDSQTYFDLPIDPNLDRLLEAHPRIFRGRKPQVWSSVPSGWLELLDKLCAQIEAMLGPDVCSQFAVVQIKQKFGTLRFYYRLGDVEDVRVDLIHPEGVKQLLFDSNPALHLDDLRVQLRAVVSEAEAASSNCCEKCGESAMLHEVRGWLTTLCGEHLAERKAMVSTGDGQ
jgi:hypothetical protein